MLNEPLDPFANAELDLAQRQALIASHPFFSRLSLEETVELARQMQEKHFHPGEAIVIEGELVDSVYLIADGTAEVTRKIQKNDKQEILFLATLSKGEAIGLSETGFFAPGGVRTATVIAQTPVLVLSIELIHFRKFIAEHRQFNSETQDAADLMLRMNFIKQVAPFAGLNLSRIRWLAQHVEEVLIPERTIIFHRGDIGDKCYLIRSGTVEILLPNADGTEKILAELKTPALFGEAALLTAMPRNATARAKEACELLVLRRKDFLDIVGVESDTSQVLSSLLKERSRPIRAEGISFYHKQTADGQTITTLKNPYNGHYYRLASDGWFIWQLIDGSNSIKDIIQKYIEKYKFAKQETISSIIYDLADNGFIELGSLSFQPPDGGAKKWTDLFTWIAVIVGLGALIGGILYVIIDRYYNPPPEEKMHGYVALAPIVKHVLVIDLDISGQVDQQSVLQGQAGILSIHQGKDQANHSADLLDFLSEFSQLVLFDSDKNGRIDFHDPIFSRLELAFLNSDGKIAKHVPIAEVGIRALILDKTNLIQYALDQNIKKMPEAANYVIMSDGSTRNMRIILIEDRYLP